MKQKGLAPILIVILIAILAVGGYLIYKQFSSNAGQTINPACYYEKVICKKAPCNPILRCEKPLPTPVFLARDNLAQQFKVSPIEIVVVLFEEIEWNDGSLGCSKAGMFYTQAIVPGYKAIFEFKQKQYEYHTDKNAQFVVCQPVTP
ncbi:hypothetical protein HYU94_03260 [Candidatus Daviesbacteria bacterium]|nr:hypothetical protein [Candidatus Daviesbacteria bacterium]